MSKKVDIIIVYQYIQWFIKQFNLFHQNKNAEIGHPKGRITQIKRDVSNSLRLWALYVFAQQQTANIAVSPYYKPKLYLSGSLSIMMGQCLAAAQHPPRYNHEKNLNHWSLDELMYFSHQLLCTADKTNSKFCRHYRSLSLQTIMIKGLE